MPDKSRFPSFFQRVREARGWRGAIHTLRIIEALIVLGVVLLVFANTVSRYVFHTSFIWIEEVLTICALWMYFIGAVLGAEEESHIKGDLISGSIKNPKIKKWFLVLVAAVTAFGILFFAAWALDYCALQTRLGMLTSYLKLPKVSSQYAIGFGMVGMAFFWVFHLLRYLTMRPSELEPHSEKKDDDEEVPE